jgi:predicted nucleotidyltransferase
MERKNKLTDYKSLDQVLYEIAESEKTALGDNFVGMYLQGSLAIGDFDMTSDVDFVVVTDHEMSAAEAGKVQAVHKDFYRQPNRWVKRLEYSFFPIEKLREKFSPYNENSSVNVTERELWYFDNGHQEIEKSDHCNTLVTRWTLREKGIIVDGPNPKTLIAEVSSDELRDEMKGTLFGWGAEIIAEPTEYENRFYQSYLVLNFCRILEDIEIGKVTSKLSGVKWAKQNLDARWIPLIDFCWQERQDPDIHVSQPANSEIFPQSIEFVKYAMQYAREKF